MTQVLQHDYGKSKVTLLEIRTAIKAVKATKSASAVSGENGGHKVGKGAAANSRKGA